MKAPKFLMALFVPAALLLGQSLAQAQDKKEAKPDAKPVQDGPTLVVESRIRQMDKVLALTEEQKQKLRPLFVEEAKTLSAVRDDKTLSLEAKIAKRKEVNAATQAKVKPLLTAEQAEKWEKLQTRTRKPTAK